MNTCVKCRGDLVTYQDEFGDWSCLTCGFQYREDSCARCGKTRLIPFLEISSWCPCADVAVNEGNLGNSDAPVKSAGGGLCPSARHERLRPKGRKRTTDRRARLAEDEEYMALAREFGRFLAEEIAVSGLTPEEYGLASGVGKDIVAGLLAGIRVLVEHVVLRLALYRAASPQQTEIIGHLLQSEDLPPIPPNPLVTSQPPGKLSTDDLQRLQHPHQRFRECLAVIHSAGIPQRRLALISGSDRSVLSRILNRVIPAPESVILRIAAAILLSPEQRDVVNRYRTVAGFEPLPEDDGGPYP